MTAPVTSPSTPDRRLDPNDRPPGFLLHAPRQLEDSVPTHTRHRLGLVLGFGAAIAGSLIAVGLTRQLGLDIPWGAWIGLFVANWVGNGGILVPIPGLRFIGWTMAVQQGAQGAAIPVGLIAGFAMALGQTTYYLSASAGSRHLHHQADPDKETSPRFPRVAGLMQRTEERIESLLRDYGVPTIFSLSALPNPFTTFASITAGSMGMGFRRFLIANFAGHVVLGLILAIFGTWLTGD